MSDDDVPPLVHCRDCARCTPAETRSGYTCGVKPQFGNLKSFPFMVTECWDYEGHEVGSA